MKIALKSILLILALSLTVVSCREEEEKSEIEQLAEEEDAKVKVKDDKVKVKTDDKKIKIKEDDGEVKKKVKIDNDDN
ncbi:MULTISPECIES: hypothetical protein [Salegentibacter]|jgi:hypothetical protein|uniref:Uncharacterized protein n=1 Tax=Salegentibacter agarivorans TaxID=345907 RepID=A0A1I2NZY3_9FLAO|nr:MULTISPECIES: hypothetical protein [Salegentibacter]MBO2545540.1 hypothetical protein [Salegentibacter sp. BDJ18]SFG09298.1 hypothetical protein SAMN04488033_12621 [Salegentibacter agarivorans]|tara:strand:+ start:49 stop:282 length:234 start_codon:yes stop_codon:yes gene_type:complete